MKRFLLLLAFLPAGATAFAQPFTTRDTRFESQSLKLGAELFIPAQPRPDRIGVALIQGSGPSDRGNAWARQFAEMLASNGLYVLLPDKRGTGQSEGDWKNSSLVDLAVDAMASVQHLKQEFNLRKTGLMGLSQGGFIAPVASSQTREVDFVVNIVGAAVPLEEQIIHEVVQTARQQGLSGEAIREVMELHVLMKRYATTGAWEPLERKFKSLENGSWAEFAKTFPRQKDHWVWNWIRLNIGFDPLPYWEKTAQPVFVGYGSKDENDNMPVYASVYRLQSAFAAAGKTNFTIRVYEAGHALYEDDRAELRGEMVRHLLEWIGRL